MSVMKTRALSLFALLVACTPEPEEKPGTGTTTQLRDDDSDTGSQSSSELATTSDTTSQASDPSSSDQGEKPEPGLGELEVHALTPEVWSGRRLRRVYQAGEDGSIGTRLDIFWDAKLRAYCELDRLDRRLGGELNPGDRLYCFPYMGAKKRCRYWYKDPECTQKVMVARADTDEIYRDLFYVFKEDESAKDCDDLATGLYKVKVFHENALERVYRMDETGVCTVDPRDEPFHTVELGDPVSLEMIASGSVVVD